MRNTHTGTGSLYVALARIVFAFFYVHLSKLNHWCLIFTVKLNHGQDLSALIYNMHFTNKNEGGGGHGNHFPEMTVTLAGTQPVK